MQTYLDSIPIYQCDSIREILGEKGVDMCFYNIDNRFEPLDIDAREEDDAVLLANYYGINVQRTYGRVGKQVPACDYRLCLGFLLQTGRGALMVYSCRKFVGVPDGAYVVGKDAHKFVEEYR